ncbi:MAG: hypothetical protein NC038_00125 [Paludibacter sp.]|nr:hypothetical protein [Bacteroidales bacterium]MCM1068755.1 hypothetical protein [Prevotella sp.]MCM1354467.1 hypothetical protein [Bacteroides sp.]MCM1443270.1 hypothetical protein [Muribaculum sp.]MCM1481045.1 hypothetical protein [Paludibacter sp.]
MDRFDKYWIGALIGLIIPAIFGYLYIDQMNLWYALQTFHMHSGAVLNKLFLVCIFPDMALIFLFYTTDTWRLAKGILIGAMPYVLASIAVSM